ncbi:MAG: STAS domain-containing protein [Deltaproteobacteria bacterium]
MPVPILKQRDVLIASIQAAPSDRDLTQLRDELLRRVGEHRSKTVIVDVTVLDVLDSFAARVLSETARMLRLRGADSIVVGIQPEVAISMVRLGLTLDDTTCTLDLEEALAMAAARRPESRAP